jgi:hypothetical protein
MLLKLRNKMTMAMDKMIEEAKELGGVPGQILLEPKEAAEFIREINHTSMKIRVKKEIDIGQKNPDEFDIRLLIWGKDPISTEDLKMIVEKWYKKEYSFRYKSLELLVVMKANPEPQVETPEGEKPKQD